MTLRRRERLDYLGTVDPAHPKYVILGATTHQEIASFYLS
jgi:hypothetical protein